MASTGRVDVHHHWFPTSFIMDKNVKHDWPMPKDATKWTPELSLKAMEKLGISKAILSWPSPAPNTHELNVEAGKVRDQYPEKFGFFASLPLGAGTPIETILKEIDFALDDLKADGIGMVSSYGTGPDAKYVGDAYYEPMWKALHERKAVVFLHGAQAKALNAPPNTLLPVPIVEVPNETYKAAAQLVTNGFKRKYPDVKIILSHSGGSTPFLACRVAVLSNYVSDMTVGSSPSIDDYLEDFKSFYYETALSGYDVNLAALEKFVGRDHIMFGTDFPAVTVEMAGWFTKNVDDFFAKDSEFHNAIMTENWAKLTKL